MSRPARSTAVLRAAALPARLWLSAASPELFDLLRRLDAEEASYRRVSGILAEHVGVCLVPAPRLTTADRRLAVEVARRLKAGGLIGAMDCQRLAAAAEVDACERDLARELRRLGDAAHALARVHRRATDAVASEKKRLLRAPWGLLRGCAAGRRVLVEAGLPARPATPPDSAHGATGRRLWQRSDRLWRVIAGAVTAPPGGQAALVPLGDSAGPLGLTGEIAAEWLANTQAPRSAGDAGVQVALTPLHRVDGDHLLVWTMDPAQPRQLTERRVRLTPVLAALVEAVHGRPRRLVEVERCVLAAATPGRTMLRECVGHLIDAGVVLMSSAPRPVRIGWQPVRAEPAHPSRPALDGRHGGRRQVFRRATGAVAAPDCRRLEYALAQVLRLAELIGADRADTDADPLRGIGEEPRPLLDVLAARRPRPARQSARPAGWAPPRTPGSGYARLVETLAGRADTAAVLDVGTGLLDACGAGPAEFTWPVDCAMRPLGPGSGMAVAAVAPAGALDAAVAGGLRRLCGDLPHGAWYRAFLEQVERRTGMPVVELRVPGCAGPPYAAAWTGEPDLGVHRNNAPAPRYVPLADLALRRVADRLVVEGPEGPVWLVYHGPRTPPAPWDTLVALLRHAAGPPAWAPDLRRSVHAFPGRRFVPRIAVAGELVVAPAQWRIPRRPLCDPHADDLAKVRALVRLRDTLGLPRWVLVSTVDDGPAVPCDLESLLAVRVFDEVSGGGSGDVLIREMVPDPASFSVADPAEDPADRVAAELVFRFPFGEDPAALAARVAAPAAAACV
jgi:hypothetical protein